MAVRVAGICGTDLELIKGYANYRGVPGHEFVGTVICGSDRLHGRRVVGEINAACGQCTACSAGLSRHCPARTVLGIVGRAGAFAQTLTLPERNLIEVPAHIDDEEAVFTEPVAAALEIFEQVHIRPGSRVLVIGDGKLGLLVAQVCALSGARTTLHGRHEGKLALARRWGIEARRVEATAGQTAGEARFPFVIECTGRGATLAEALPWTAPRGTLLLKSTYAPGLPPVVDWTRVVVDEISVVGSRCGLFAPALQWIGSGRLDVRSLIDGRFTLEEGREALAWAARPGALKSLLRPG